jgi:hypothetical protein
VSEEAVILGAQIVAGHDGSAELLVRLRHPGGQVGSVLLDVEAGLRLIEACDADGPDGLIGQSWRKIVGEA